MVFVPKKILFQISQNKKNDGVYCCAISCSNKPCAKKAGLCHKHYHRYWRILDPVYDRYANFKQKALSRKKEFTITLMEFRGFCEETGYIITKGMRGYRYTVDRINNNYGYHIWNIQLLSLIANIEKYHEIDKLLTEPNEGEILF